MIRTFDVYPDPMYITDHKIHFYVRPIIDLWLWKFCFFAATDYLCRHGRLDLKTSLGRCWERKYSLLVPSDSECRGPIPSRSYSYSEYYLQDGSVAVCSIICRCAPAIFMSQLIEHKPERVFFFFTLLQLKKMGFEFLHQGSFGTAVCLFATVLTCRQSLSCDCLRLWGSSGQWPSVQDCLGDEASRHFQAEAQFLGKFVS